MKQNDTVRYLGNEDNYYRQAGKVTGVYTSNEYIEVTFSDNTVLDDVKTSDVEKLNQFIESDVFYLDAGERKITWFSQNHDEIVKNVLEYHRIDNILKQSSNVSGFYQKADEEAEQYIAEKGGNLYKEFENIIKSNTHDFSGLNRKTMAELSTKITEYNKPFSQEQTQEI